MLQSLNSPDFAPMTHVPELEQWANNQMPKAGWRELRLVRFDGTDLYQWRGKKGVKQAKGWPRDWSVFEDEASPVFRILPREQSLTKPVRATTGAKIVHLVRCIADVIAGFPDEVVEANKVAVDRCIDAMDAISKEELREIMGTDVKSVNPAEALRAIAVDTASHLGLDVNHEAFDKLAATLDEPIMPLPGETDDEYQRRCTGV